MSDAEVESVKQHILRERRLKRRQPMTVTITRSQAETFEKWRTSDSFIEDLWGGDYDGPCPFCARPLKLRIDGTPRTYEWKCGSFARVTLRQGRAFGKLLRHRYCIRAPYEVKPDRARPSYRPPVPLIEV